jgi:hypothetical protein
MYTHSHTHTHKHTHTHTYIYIYIYIYISVFLNQWGAFQLWFAKLFLVGRKTIHMMNLLHMFIITSVHIFRTPSYFTSIFICDSWCRKRGHKPCLIRSSDTFSITAILSNGMQCISSLGCRIPSQIVAHFKSTKVIIFATVHKDTHFTEYQNYCYGLLICVVIFFQEFIICIYFACLSISFIVPGLKISIRWKQLVTVALKVIFRT